MLHYFKNVENRLSEVSEITDNIWVNIVPPLSRDEFTSLADSLQIPLDFLTDSLDIDERSRYEEDNNVKLIVIKTPIHNTSAEGLFGEAVSCITIPICIILTHNHIVTINSFDNHTIEHFLNRLDSSYIEKRNVMVLRILEKIVHTFLYFLKEINYKRNILEKQLYLSNSNEILLQIMEIQKSLVYLVTALKLNETLVSKMDRTNFLQLNDEEKEFLQDILIDVTQAKEMAETYTTILSSTMDAFASIISNNQNQVLKKLTLITIILQLPVLISSIYGMNVPLPYQDSPFAFYIPIVISALLSVIVGLIFIRKKNH